MIDEMTAMNKEISKLKAEVAMLREALIDIKQELEIAPSDSQELQDKPRFTIETLNYCHSIAITALEDNRFAANVTSEELQDMDAILDDMMADELNEAAFKVGDEVKFKHSDEYRGVIKSFYTDEYGDSCAFVNWDGIISYNLHYLSVLERA